MKAVSCFSTQMDPYRAGLELGEELVTINPEIIFLITSVHYEGSSELTSAIYEVLGNDHVVLIGNTGDGFYERNKVADFGVSALGINSEGAVRWHLASASGVEETPKEATRSCMEQLKAACGSAMPSFYYFVTDYRTDTSEILTALQEMTSLPVVGGAAADDFSFKQSFVYANHEVLEDSIVMLAAEGAVSFDISIAQDIRPVGNSGKITQCSGTRIKMIDDQPAMNFVEQELGKPVVGTDGGVVTLKLLGKNEQEQCLRALLSPPEQQRSGDVDLFGGVEQGSFVKVCLAQPDEVIQDVKNVVSSLSDLPFNPVAGLIVSCAGRKRLLGEKIECEVTELADQYPDLKALVGFPSFGEFGPVKQGDKYSRPLFHNMTFILLLLGEAKS